METIGMTAGKTATVTAADFAVCASSERSSGIYPTLDHHVPQTAKQQYLQYWKEKWRVHPRNRSKVTHDQPLDDEAAEETFDWQYFVTMHDYVYKWAQKGKMVTAKPPKYIRKMTIRGGHEIPVPYQTYYEGKFAEAKEDDLYTEKFSLTHYDERTHYKFTIGNFEAALKITRPLWLPRIRKGKGKQWQHVITPMCFEFLADLQKELTGYTKEWFNDWNAMNNTPVFVKRSETEILEVVDNTEREVLQRQECATFAVETEDCLQVKTTNIDEAPCPIHMISPEEYQKNNMPGFRKKDIWAFRWYPKISAFHKALAPQRKDRSTVFLSYFDNLAEVYLRIGRPDLAARISSNVRQNWLRSKVIKSYTPHRFAQYRPPMDWTAQSGACAPNKYREKAYRILDSYRIILMRHRDKMEVMSHRGRFAYLKNWDELLYARQRKVILTIDERFVKNYVNTLADQEVCLPKSYVEQAEEALNLCNNASIVRDDRTLCKALKALLILVSDWTLNEKLIPARTFCVQAQAGEKAVGASAGGSASSVGVPTKTESTDVPVTAAKTDVTLTSVDQRETTKARETGTKGKTHKETVAELPYTLQDMCKRPMLIDRVTWKAGQGIGTEIKQWIVPDIYFSADEKAKTSVCQNLTATYIVSCYGAFKYQKMRIDVKTNTQTFNSGKMILYFKPYYTSYQTQDIFHNVIQFPHVIIDASVSNSGTMDVPWINVRDAFPTYADPHEEINYCGTLHLAVWNEFGVGATGSNDASVTIWMSLHGVEVYQLANPKAPGNIHFASTIRGASSQPGTSERYLTRTFPKVSKVETWEAQSLVDQLMATGSDLVKDVGANLVEEALQTAVKGLPLLLAKPHMVNPPRPVTIMSCQNPALSEGVDLAQTLRLDPRGCLAPDPDFEKPVNLRDLIRTWSRVRVWELLLADAENSTVGKLPVLPMLNAVEQSGRITRTVEYLPRNKKQTSPHPGCDSANDYVSTQVGSVKRAGTMLDYLCRGFHGCTGSIDVKFEAVASLHSARLLIRYEPYGGDSTAKEECQKMATPGIVWDVRENKELIITLPLNTTQPMLTTEFVSDGVVHDELLTQTACGILELTVVNKLKVTPGIKQSMDINVYMRAGKDFEFAYLKPLNSIMALKQSNLMVPSPVVAKDRIGEILLGIWNAANHVVLVNGVNLTKEISGGYQYAYANDGIYYPFAMRKDGKDKSRYWNFTQNLLDFFSIWETVNKLIKADLPIPKFRTLQAAFTWLVSIDGIDSRWMDFMKEMKLEVTYEELQKHYWALAVVLMFENAWGIREIPIATVRGNSIIPSMVSVTKAPKPKTVEWTAQSKTITRQELDKQMTGINPFKANKDESKSVKSMYGEGFMDMYSHMRRYQLAFDFQVPPSWRDDDNSNYEKYLEKDTCQTIMSMTPDERKQWFWEIAFPVTPMVCYDQIGSVYTNFVDLPHAYSIIPLFNDKEVFKPGGAAFSNKANLVSSRWYGELATQWSGSMNYGLVVDDAVDEEGKPWQMYVTYHPRHFVDWQSGRNSWTIVHKTRIRELSRQGQLNWNTTVQQTMFINAPFYSKYRRLMLDDSNIDETTSCGSIIIHIPIRTNGAGWCENKPWAENEADRLMVAAPKIAVMTSVGDDMRYYVPRAAPYQALWPRAFDVTPSWKQQDNGYDDIGTAKAMAIDRKMLRPLGEYTKVVQESGKLEEGSWKNPIEGVTKLKVVDWYDEQLPAKDRREASYLDTIRRFRIVKRGTDPVKPPVTEKTWVAQSDDDVYVTPPQEPAEILPPIQEEPQTVTVTEVAEDAIDGFISSAASVVSDFKTTLVAAQNVLTDIKDVAASVSKNSAAVTEKVTETSSLVSKIATYSFNATRLVVFFNGIKQMLEAETWNERWIPLSTCALALGLSPDIVMKAGEYMMSIISSIFGTEKVHETRTPQAYEDTWDQSWTSFVEEHSSVLRFIAAGVVTMITFYLTSSAPVASKVSSFSGSMLQKLRNFAIVGTALKTLDWMWKWISEVIKTALTTVADWVSGGMITASRMANHYPEVISWMRKVETYGTDVMTSELAWNPDARHELWLRMDEGDELLTRLTSKTGALYNTLMRGMTTLQKAHDKTLSIREAVPVRIDPFHVCLTGPPGIGKSAITTFVMNFVLDELGYPKRNRFYNRCEEDDYWTKYFGQVCVLIDDLYSNKKGKAIHELIKMKSNLAFSLNMADVNEKGRDFTSHFVGSNTNVAFPKPDDSVTPAAIHRRRDVLARVKRRGPREPGARPDWNMLSFDILQPDQRNGMEIVLIADLTLVSFLEFVTESAAQYLATQKALVFSCLQGKSITLHDYGDSEPAPVEPVSSALDSLVNLLKLKVTVQRPYLIKVLESLSYVEFGQAVQIPEIKKLLTDNPWADDEMHIHRAKSKIFLLRDEVKAVPNVEPTWLNACVSTNDMIMTVGPPETQYQPYVNGVNMSAAYGYLTVTAGIYTWHEPEIMEPQPGTSGQHAQNDEWSFEEWINTDEEDSDELRKAAHRYRKSAKQCVEIKNRLMANHQPVIDSIIKRKPGQVVRMVDENEMKIYVSKCYSNCKPEDRAAIEKQLTKVFENASKQHTLHAMTKSEYDRQFSALFQPKYAKYWKEKDGNWLMEFPEEFAMVDGDEMEIWTLYDYMVQQWTPEQINESKKLCVEPVKLRDTVYINKLVTFYEAQRKKISGWVKDHPKIVATIKIGLSIAAVFASYKALSWLCPKVFEKIKDLLWGLFGWTTAKIGEERVAKIVETGKATATAVKKRTREYYDWVKSLMVGSDDAELIRLSTDDAAVQMVAESLTRKVKNTKNELLMCEASRSAEGKRKLNAYMIGNQDRVMAETATKNIVHVPARPGVESSPQGSSDAGATAIRVNLLTKNMCRISWANSEKCVTMSALCIRDRLLLIPGHFFQSADEGQHFVMVMPSGVEHWQAYDPRRAIKLKNQDAIVYMGSMRLPCFRNLLQHFVPMESLNFSKTPATLNVLSESLTMLVHNTTADLVTEVNYQYDGTMVRNAYAWEYPVATSAGDCGGVLLADNNAVRNKILGIHVCGSTGMNCGSSAYISREQLDEAVGLLETDGVLWSNYVPQGLITKPISQMKIQPQGNFELLGAVAPSKAVRLPHKTEIFPSAIHDCVREHVSEPAVLTTNDPRNESGASPLGKALSKYGAPTLPFSPCRLRYVADDIQSEVMVWQTVMPKRKLTDHEAVFGNEMIDYCDRMNLSASPGYPYTLTRPSGQKGKGYLFDVNALDGIADEKYRDEYQAREMLARAGIRKLSLWTDCLKDERRPIAKIKAGKTRAFMLPPADYVQLCRKYFMSFCVAFYENRIRSFSAVGIDPYSFEWTKLVRKLKRKSNLGFGGDFHSFDGIFDPDILEQVVRIINNWYATDNTGDFDPQDNVVRSVLADEMIHTVHICLDSVYRKCQGNPSGNPLTVIINTFAHCFYLRLAWMGLAERADPEMASMHRYHQHVAEMYYGDDGLLAVKYEPSAWFNLETVSAFLHQYNIEYTSESKDEDLYGVRRVTDCTFLKNGFSRLEGSMLWIAPINPDTIYELTNWVRSSDDPLAQLRENLENAINFAFHHGRPFFERFCSEVNTALRARGLREIACSFEVLREAFEAKCRA